MFGGPDIMVMLSLDGGIAAEEDEVEGTEAWLFLNTSILPARPRLLPRPPANLFPPDGGGGAIMADDDDGGPVEGI